MNHPRVFKSVVIGLMLVGLAAANVIADQVTKEEFTLAAVGDCIISSKVSPLHDARFLKLVDLLRTADVAWGNCETTLFDPRNGSPSYKTIDPNLFCWPWAADEFKWLGLDLMALANNHIMDFGKEGLFATIENLERVGIGYAGAGKDLEDASRPGYIDSSAGRIGQVSCASWMGEKQNQAAPKNPHMNGRPGLNPINTDWYLEVDNKDIERIVGEVKVAKHNSRLVIVSLHEHLGGNNQTGPTEYQENFARKCIDAGADLFFGTGAHQLWGIEIYKGKPIFHGLGNFFFQETRLISAEAYKRIGLPADCTDPIAYAEKFAAYFTEDAIWESVLARITFDGSNKVTAIELHPFLLGKDEATIERGLPRLADKEQAKKIIERLQKMSAGYNTTIEFQKGIGRVILR